MISVTFRNILRRPKVSALFCMGIFRVPFHGRPALRRAVRTAILALVLLLQAVRAAPCPRFCVFLLLCRWKIFCFFMGLFWPHPAPLPPRILAFNNAGPGVPGAHVWVMGIWDPVTPKCWRTRSNFHFFLSISKLVFFAVFGPVPLNGTPGPAFREPCSGLKPGYSGWRRPWRGSENLAFLDLRLEGELGPKLFLNERRSS